MPTIIKHPDGNRTWPIDYMSPPDKENPAIFYLAPITRERTAWIYMKQSKGGPTIRTVRPEHDMISLLRLRS